MAKAKKKTVDDKTKATSEDGAPDVMSLDEMLAEAIEAEVANSAAPSSDADEDEDTSQDSTGSANDADIAEFESEIETLRTERDDMRDRFMRALADAENARKRGERDRREGEQYGGQNWRATCCRCTITSSAPLMPRAIRQAMNRPVMSKP